MNCFDCRLGATAQMQWRSAVIVVGAMSRSRTRFAALAYPDRSDQSHCDRGATGTHDPMRGVPGSSRRRAGLALRGNRLMAAVRMGCAECGCVIESGVRVVVCSDDCCCSDVPVSEQATRVSISANPTQPTLRGDKARFIDGR